MSSVRCRERPRHCRRRLQAGRRRAVEAWTGTVDQDDCRVERVPCICAELPRLAPFSDQTLDCLGCCTHWPPAAPPPHHHQACESGVLLPSLFRAPPPSSLLSLTVAAVAGRRAPQSLHCVDPRSHTLSNFWSRQYHCAGRSHALPHSTASDHSHLPPVRREPSSLPPVQTHIEPPWTRPERTQSRPWTRTMSYIRARGVER